MTAPRILGIDSPPQNVNAPVVPWHYDYLLRFGAIADGDSKIIDLIIQAGSPFVLRGIGGYNVEPGEGEEPTTVLPLTGGFIEFRTHRTSGSFPTPSRSRQTGLEGA